MPDQSRGPLEILLVEDNRADAELAREALGELAVPTRVSWVEEGEQAMAYLRRQGPHSKVARPDLILLDLNLPRKSGLEVLAEVKSDPELAAVPVVVLTTSASPLDVYKCYALHANCYVTKPGELDRFFQIVRSLGEFWFATAKLPRDHPGVLPEGKVV